MYAFDLARELRRVGQLRASIQSGRNRDCAIYVNHTYSGMEFDFDPTKDEANRFKHGLRLSFGKRVFDDPDHIVLGSHRFIDGEDRFKALGLVEGRLHIAVFVWREDIVRLISVRRSNASEQRDYDRHTGRSQRP